MAGLEWCHAEFDELPGYRIHTRQVEQAKIMPILIVAADALVVIDQIPAAVQDQLSLVDLDWSRMVR